MIILLWEIFLLVNNKFFPIFERWIKPFRKKEGKNISEDRSWALWADSCYNLAMGEAQMCTIQNSSHCFRFGLPRSRTGKESTCQSRRHRFDPWVRKIPWRRKWQPAPVFCRGNPLDRGAWWATGHRVAKSQLQLSKWACKPLVLKYKQTKLKVPQTLWHIWPLVGISSVQFSSVA